MGASKMRWKGPLTSEQRDEDIRSLLLIIASALTTFDELSRTEVRVALVEFLNRRREPVPGDGH